MHFQEDETVHALMQQVYLLPRTDDIDYQDLHVIAMTSGLQLQAARLRLEAAESPPAEDLD